MTVNTNIMNDNFNQLQNEGNFVQESDELFDQLKNKVHNDMNKDMGFNESLQVTNKQQEKDTKLEDYLKELKNM